MANALFGVVLQTIETRYGLNSTQSGFIGASYEIASTVAVLFVIFYAKKISPMKCVAIGSLTISIGGFVFCLPQFFSLVYDPFDKGNTGTTTIWLWFVLGMFIIGVGSIPLGIFPYTYFDTNCAKTIAPMYHGLISFGSFLGTLVGFTTGGKFLKIPVDYYRQDSANGINQDLEDETFVGAWWLPFIICSGLLILSAFFVYPFPAKLSGRPRKDEFVTSNQEVSFSETYSKLLKNKTLLFANFGFCCDAFIVQAMLSFVIKFFEQQYNATPDEGSSAVAIICVCGMIGQVIGAVFYAKINPSVKNSMRVCVLVPLSGAVLSAAMLIKCPSRIYPGFIDGKIIPASTTSQFLEFSRQKCGVDADCDSNCNLITYSPVCDIITNTHYFSDCFVGFDKTCINATNVFGTRSIVAPDRLQPGLCPNEAVCPTATSKMKTATALMAVMFFFKAMAATPLLNTFIRCVGNNQRDEALALSSFTTRILGSIPGPIIIGRVLDSTCVIWSENNLCEKTNCVSYDHDQMSRAFFLWFVGLKLLAAAFFYASSLYAHQSEETGDDYETKLVEESDFELPVEVASGNFII